MFARFSIKFTKEKFFNIIILTCDDDNFSRKEFSCSQKRERERSRRGDVAESVEEVLLLHICYQYKVIVKLALIPHYKF